MPLSAFGNFPPVSNVEPMQVDADPQDHDVADQQSTERNFIVENPTLDLDAHVSGYKGIMKIERLLFVAAHAPSLRVDALRSAWQLVRNTLNVGLYEDIHEKLADAVRSSSVLPDAVAGLVQAPSIDRTWVENTSKHATSILEKLDIDLKNYKSNSIKESIRRGYDDLGSHYLSMGDFNNALKCFSRARDYCTSPKHIIGMCLNVIKVCVFLGNWSHVLTYVSKAEAHRSSGEKEKENLNQTTFTKLKCAAGIAYLAMGKYKLAAKNFLQASVDHCDFPELVSPNNVAVYGSLCVLATFNRHELQSQVISSGSFKLLLELEPTIREVVTAFYKSQYGRCLALLEECRDNLLLDFYISAHVDKIYAQIRCRALVQYFTPYKLADMRRMASAFNSSVNELEDELMPLILDGQIQARIDSQNKILLARETDHRRLTFVRTLQVGKEYLHRTKATILRNAVIRNNLSVQIQQPNKENEVASGGR